MRKCPSCDFLNIDTRDRCLKCKTILVDPEVVTEGNQQDLLLRRRPRLGQEALSLPFQRQIVRFFNFVIDIVLKIVNPNPEKEMRRRYYLLAGLLGMVPGLGQIYNRQYPKAFILIVAQIVTVWLSARFILESWGNIFIIGAIGVAMISCADSMISAAQINGQDFTLRNRLAMLTYPIFLLGFFGFIIGVMSFLHCSPITLFYINRNYMQPVICEGDRICTEFVTYWNRNPAPGDVVHYDPPGYKIEFYNDIQSIDPLSGWERVMATGGERLECRKGIYYVNGRKLSPEYYPLVTGKFFDSFEIDCPPGKYIVLSSSRVEDGINEIFGPYAGILALSEAGGVTTWKTLDPKQPRVIVIGWNESCIVDRKAIFGRAWFRYNPTPRRSFFKPEGPRFER